MGILDTIVGAGVKNVGEGVKAGLEGVTGLVQGLRSAIKGEPTPEKMAEIQEKVIELDHALINFDKQINLAEAQSGSNFRGGWRPAIGWTCAIALFCFYVPKALLGAILWTMQSWNMNTLLPYPDMPLSDIMGLVFTLLGSATLRSVEAMKGVKSR